jgi:hypothetical protein
VKETFGARRPANDEEWIRWNDLSHYEGGRLGRLRHAVRWGLLHVTSPLGFRGIKSAGAILPNQGQFPPTFPQSLNSFARCRGVVSLFDFESASDLQVAGTWINSEDFFYCHKPATYALWLNRALLPARLITYEEAKAEVGYRRVKIPHIEVWCPVPIPFAAVAKVTVIVRADRLRHRTFRPTSRALLDVETLMATHFPDCLGR